MQAMSSSLQATDTKSHLSGSYGIICKKRLQYVSIIKIDSWVCRGRRQCLEQMAEGRFPDSPCRSPSRLGRGVGSGRTLCRERPGLLQPQGPGCSPADHHPAAPSRCGVALFAALLYKAELHQLPLLDFRHKHMIAVLQTIIQQPCCPATAFLVALISRAEFINVFDYTGCMLWPAF